jgi:8-oxo-dGTP diphosphatase
LVRNGTESSWSFPGGAVEHSETLEKGVIREVEEQTGLKIMPRGLYSVREILFKQRGENAFIFTFISINNRWRNSCFRSR